MQHKPILPRAPDDTHRHVIVGQTGSGKTVAGVFALSRRSYDVMPWIVANYKNDEYLNQIPHQEISPFGKLPTKPGLYMVRPECEAGSLDHLLELAHRRAKAGGGGTGFYIDEGYEVGANSLAFRRVLTQGRSLHLPVIVLSQRPVWMSKWVFTEASFIQAFPLLAVEDRRKIVEWLPSRMTDELRTPIDVNYPETLAEYQSIYFDAGKTRCVRFDATPFGPDVLDVFFRRIPPEEQAHKRFTK